MNQEEGITIHVHLNIPSLSLTGFMGFLHPNSRLQSGRTSRLFLGWFHMKTSGRGQTNCTSLIQARGEATIPLQPWGCPSLKYPMRPPWGICQHQEADGQTDGWMAREAADSRGKWGGPALALLGHDEVAEHVEGVAVGVHSQHLATLLVDLQEARVVQADHGYQWALGAAEADLLCTRRQKRANQEGSQQGGWGDLRMEPGGQEM